MDLIVTGSQGWRNRRAASRVLGTDRVERRSSHFKDMIIWNFRQRGRRITFRLVCSIKKCELFQGSVKQFCGACGSTMAGHAVYFSIISGVLDFVNPS
jgi:hypothetical protein